MSSRVFPAPSSTTYDLCASPSNSIEGALSYPAPLYDPVIFPSASTIGSITTLVTAPSVTRADNCASEVIVSPAAGNTCTVGAA